jgi:hypothetical protein
MRVGRVRAALSPPIAHAAPMDRAGRKGHGSSESTHSPGCNKDHAAGMKGQKGVLSIAVRGICRGPGPGEVKSQERGTKGYRLRTAGRS